MRHFLNPESFYSGEIKCSVEWTIEDFKNLTEKKGDLIFSDTFEINEPDGRITEWQMMFFPKVKVGPRMEIHLYFYQASTVLMRKSTTCSQSWMHQKIDKTASYTKIRCLKMLKTELPVVA